MGIKPVVKKVVKPVVKEVQEVTVETLAPVAPPVDIKAIIEEYANLSAKEKEIKERKSELSAIIKQYAQLNGTKDSNGSYYSEQDNFVYGATAKKKIALNREKAEKFFKGKKLWKKVIDIVETINESKVEALVTEGKITFEDIESISDIDVSYSVLVKPKQTAEEMPEVQVSGGTKKTTKSTRKKK